jgi:hypothetical protein
MELEMCRREEFVPEFPLRQSGRTPNPEDERKFPPETLLENSTHIPLHGSRFAIARGPVDIAASQALVDPIPKPGDHPVHRRGIYGVFLPQHGMASGDRAGRLHPRRLALLKLGLNLDR